MKATKTRVKGNYGTWFFVKENGYSLERMDVIGQLGADLVSVLGCFFLTFQIFG
jgi:hypothetical protein